MIKALKLILLVVILILILAGCGSTSPLGGCHVYLQAVKSGSGEVLGSQCVTECKKSECTDEFLVKWYEYMNEKYQKCFTWVILWMDDEPHGVYSMKVGFERNCVLNYDGSSYDIVKSGEQCYVEGGVVKVFE